MRREILLLAFLFASITSEAVARYPMLDKDHVRMAKINKGIAFGIGGAGLGFVIGTGVYHIMKDAYWDEQYDHWNFQFRGGLISKDEFNYQMQRVDRGRDDLYNLTRRNYIISGAMFAASIGFFLNARRHSMKIGREMAIVVVPEGLYVRYSF